MNTPDYEKAKTACWNFAKFPSHTLKMNFDFVFDSAYYLGKQVGHAEDEDLLSVNADHIKVLYQEAKAKETAATRTDAVGLAACCHGFQMAMEILFGSKCLPDENSCNVDSSESNVDNLETQAAPKFKKGDWVRVISTDKYGHIGQITEVEFEHGNIYYQVSSAEGWHFLGKNLELYTDSKGNVNLSQNIANCDKHFDNILKDSFSKERRLNIAAQIMSGMMSNQIMLRNLVQGEATPEGAVKCIVNATMMYADALIAECGFSAQPQESSEKEYNCKHYKDGVCLARDNTKCLNTLFSVRNGYQKPYCPDNQPKDKKRNGN